MTEDNREVILSYQNHMLLGTKFSIKSKDSVNPDSKMAKFYRDEQKKLNAKKKNNIPLTDEDQAMEKEIIQFNVRTQEYARAAALQKEKQALAVIRFIVSYLLKWSPSEACECFDDALAEALGLPDVIKYISIPPGMDGKKDYDYVICKAFGLKYDLKKQTLTMYKRVLNGERERFPKELFSSEYGEERLAILLREFIAANFPSITSEGLYEIFGDSARANKLLQKACLFNAYRDIYATPLDYLHAALRLRDRNDFLYIYQEHRNCCREVAAVRAKEEAAARKLAAKNAAK